VDVEPVVLLIDGHYLQADDPDELTTHTGLADTALLPMTYALSVLVEGEHERRGGTVR